MLSWCALAVTVAGCGGPLAPDRQPITDDSSAFVLDLLTRNCVRVTVADSVLPIGDVTELAVVRTSAATRGMHARQTPGVQVRNAAVAQLSGAQLRAVGAGTTHVLVTDLGCTDSAKVTVRPPTSPAPTVRPGFYVSPNGRSVLSANGSIDQPWDLATALAQPARVAPGDTIWLTEGLYRGDYRSNLRGTAERPIVVRALPGQRATVDGSLTVNGSHSWFWGIEVMYSDPKRVTTLAGSDPADLPREGKNVAVNGPFNKLIEMVIHDLGEGVFSGVAAEGLEITGCVIYNNGWIGPDRAHGHAIYLQNAGTPKIVRNNLLIHSFAASVHIFGSSNASLSNMYFEGNTMIGAGQPAFSEYGTFSHILVQGGAPGTLRNIRFNQNSIYHYDGASRVLRFGIGLVPTGFDLTFTGNIVHGEPEFLPWNGYTVTGNTFANSLFNSRQNSGLIILDLGTNQPAITHVWRNNAYITNAQPFQNPLILRAPDGVSRFLLDQWRARTGHDIGSSLTFARPAQDSAAVRASGYGRGHALVTVWNWTGSTSATFSASGVLTNGERYAVHAATSPYGAPVTTGTFDGQRIRVPLTSLRIDPPIGRSAVAIPTEPRVHAFILTRLPM